MYKRQHACTYITVFVYASVHPYHSFVLSPVDASLRVQIKKSATADPAQPNYSATLEMSEVSKQLARLRVSSCICDICIDLMYVRCGYGWKRGSTET